MDLTPFLMFTGTAEEAMRFYASSFPGAEILRLERFAPGEPGREGTVRLGLLRIGNKSVRCFDSSVEHAFGFTPAMSLFVDCDTVEDVARLFDLLRDGGHVLMPLDRYWFAESFAWVEDRFGVSWQLNYQPAG